MDLVIRNGTVVTSGSTFTANIGILNGRIAQIGGKMSGSREIDATGKLVLPGGIDMHVHFTEFWHFHFADDFYSGTTCAAAGGITTVGNMAIPRDGEKPLESLNRTAAEAKANAIVDFTLHPAIFDPSPEAIAEFPRLVDMGYTTIKVFTVLPPFDQRVEDYILAVKAAHRSEMLTMIHCEDAGIISFTERQLLTEGKSDVGYYPDSRSRDSEAVATARAVGIAEATGAPIYVVHVSSVAALEECCKGQNKGLPVYVETRPIYLYLTRERYLEPNGAKYASWPPLRERVDMDALWNGLRVGDIHTLCSDHAPYSLAEKLDPALKVGTFRPGMANVEQLMPMLFSEGVNKGRLSLERFVEVTSTNAAKLFGMFPLKGTVAVGSDADLVVWNPNQRHVIRAREMHSKSDFDAYEGWEVQGWPVYTISRGEVVFEKGQVKAFRGRGQLVKRGRYMPL